MNWSLLELLKRLRVYLHVISQHNALVEPMDWYCDRCAGGVH